MRAALVQVAGALLLVAGFAVLVLLALNGVPREVLGLVFAPAVAVAVAGAELVRFGDLAPEAPSRDVVIEALS